MDNNVFTVNGAFQGYSLNELRARVRSGVHNNERMIAEIERREAVAAGDMSRATAGERLNAARR